MLSGDWPPDKYISTMVVCLVVVTALMWGALPIAIEVRSPIPFVPGLIAGGFALLPAIGLYRWTKKH